MNLAETIPTTTITHGQGEPVFPQLYTMLRNHPRLLELAKQREQYGIAKYGQTLMTGDERDTPTEIVNEALDLLVYLQKYIMQIGFDDWIGDIQARQIQLIEDMMEHIEVWR